MLIRPIRDVTGSTSFSDLSILFCSELNYVSRRRKVTFQKVIVSHYKNKIVAQVI